MNELDRSDIIEVRDSNRKRGEGDEAGSFNPASVADAAEIAGVGAVSGAEWQMVTTAKAKGSSKKKAIGHARVDVAARGEAVQSVAFNFKGASAAERKRKAEECVNDQLLALRQTIVQLMNAQKEMTESQKTLMESNKTLMETIKAQAEEIKTLKAMIENNVRQPSYSEAVAGHKAVNGAKEKETQADPARFPATKKSGPPVQDERAVSIDTGRYKGAKTNFAAIKANLQASLKVNKVTES